MATIVSFYQKKKHLVSSHYELILGIYFASRNVYEAIALLSFLMVEKPIEIHVMGIFKFLMVIYW